MRAVERTEDHLDASRRLLEEQEGELKVIRFLCIVLQRSRDHISSQCNPNYGCSGGRVVACRSPTNAVQFPAGDMIPVP